ncbi:MAG: Ada metal-binding domain-containing protein [Patescibacteria group bacterium]
MSIPDLQEAGKEGVRRIPADMLVILILVLSCTAAFALGVLAGKEMEQGSGGDKVWIEQLSKSEGLPAAVASAPAAAATELAAQAAGKYVASKSGSKYHLPTCSGAKRIKEENKVWFDTKEQAAAAGYGPASNCPGL